VTYSISVNPSSLEQRIGDVLNGARQIGRDAYDSRSRVVSGGGSFVAAEPGRQEPGSTERSEAGQSFTSIEGRCRMASLSLEPAVAQVFSSRLISSTKTPIGARRR
jgi:hypothetical protein